MTVLRIGRGRCRASSIILGCLFAAGDCGNARADAILFWNQEIQALEQSAPAPTPMATGRDLAMLNVAMYDAVNAAAGSPDPSLYPTGLVIPGSSPEAAADAAAYGFLTQRFAGQSAQITAAYNSQVGPLPNNAATTNGLTLGQNQASIVLTARANDGSTAPGNFVPGNGPGQWRPTPPAFAPYATANWATVTPFTLTSPGEFRPAGPPALGSAAYAAGLAQVQSLGATNSMTRTADQTAAAEFWDSDGRGGVPLAWNYIALQVAATKNDSLLQNAQIFAVLGVTEVDAFIASFDSKSTFAFWRPVTAIQNSTDPTWQPLLAAPPFPSYVANHAAVPEAGATVLAAMFGSDTADFSLTYNTDNSSAATLGNPTFGVVTRDFTSFSEAATEAGMARIWGGVHYDFDVADGYILGQEVGLNALAQFDVPEPASVALLGLALLLLGVARVRSRRRNQTPPIS